ncbi:MAG: DNA/RNA nuclease SfsA [Bacteroidota bacterium]
MKFDTPLVPGRLIRRYKRFLADVMLENGEVVTAHCTNSGTMKSCLEEGAEVMLSRATDPKRKTRFTWEMISIGGNWVGINTGIPNKLAYEALKNNRIMGLRGFTTIRREVRFGDSRFDLYAEKPGEKCFIEVKNVTLKDGIWARFPDAVTVRGLKHLHGLMEVRRLGMRAVMLYIIQRSDVEIFGPARDIDPAYANALLLAFLEGVEVIPVMAGITTGEIITGRIMPFDLGQS